MKIDYKDIPNWLTIDHIRDALERLDVNADEDIADDVRTAFDAIDNACHTIRNREESPEQSLRTRDYLTARGQ